LAEFRAALNGGPSGRRFAFARRFAYESGGN